VPDAPPPPPAPAGARKIGEELRAILRRQRQVWHLVARRDKIALAGAVGVMAVASLADNGIAVLLGTFFEWVKNLQAPPETLFRRALLYLSILAGLYLVKESLQLGRRYLVHGTCTRIERDAMIKLVSHLLMVDLTALARDRVGSLHGRITRAVEGYVKFLRVSFTDFLPATLTACFAFVLALLQDYRVGLVMVAVIPSSVAITFWQLRSQKGIRLELLRTKEAMDGTVVEQLTGLEYIRAANTHTREAARVAAVAEARRGKELGHHTAMGWFDWAKSLNEGLFHIFVLGLAVYLAATDRMPFGKVITFSMLFLNVMRPLREVHRILDDAYESSLQVDVLLQMLGQPVDRSFGTVTVRRPDMHGDAPAIVISDLHVHYRAADGYVRHALRGVSTTIRRGETIGAAGPSGSGKSTWLRALMRLIHPSGGVVMIGGVPIDGVSREDIASLVGYVSQVPFVFSGTVAENIAYGTADAGEDDVRRAAEMACIHDEIMAMPLGYQTMLNERGGNLSGGQRQRIALARLFLRNPPILILDEATSALDNISERKVQAAIARARAERTVILVAHRLSTLRDADRILVFEDGRIVEEGPYEELVARGGVFCELVRSGEAATA
jgi:ATP-binding cassette, subfamily B, bacterial